MQMKVSFSVKYDNDKHALMQLSGKLMLSLYFSLNYSKARQPESHC